MTMEKRALNIRNIQSIGGPPRENLFGDCGIRGGVLRLASLEYESP